MFNKYQANIDLITVELKRRRKLNRISASQPFHSLEAEENIVPLMAENQTDFQGCLYE